MPSESAIKKRAQRERQRHNPRPNAPTCLAELVLEQEDCLSLDGHEMLQFDNNDDERRIVILATSDDLDILQESPSWYVDGTFNSCPQLFYQILTFHAEIPNPTGTSWVFPSAYILLTNKDTEIYTECFDALVALRNFSPETIMLDFELALKNALTLAFPSATLDNCFFHISQVVLEAVKRLGYKQEYERITVSTTGQQSYSSLCIWVRRLMMLAFVPVEEVRDSYYFILDQLPEDLHIDDLLAYFQTTWAEGLSTGRRAPGNARFPPETWNCFDRTVALLNRTNNYVESWNKKFAGLVGHSHPTIWNFLAAVRLEQASVDGKISAYRHGQQPPKRKPAYIKKDDAILAIVNRQHIYDGRLIEYLDLLRDEM